MSHVLIWARGLWSEHRKLGAILVSSVTHVGHHLVNLINWALQKVPREQCCGASHRKSIHGLFFHWWLHHKDEDVNIYIYQIVNIHTTSKYCVHQPLKTMTLGKCVKCMCAHMVLGPTLSHPNNLFCYHCTNKTCWCMTEADSLEAASPPTSWLSLRTQNVKSTATLFGSHETMIQHRLTFSGTTKT